MKGKSLYLFLTVCLTALCVTSISLAQIIPRDSTSQPAALRYAVSLFNSSLNIQAPLYTGAEYYFYDPHIKGSANYGEVNDFSTGSIEYDGVLFNNIPLLYDENLDLVAVLFPNRASRFSLIKERIKQFDLLGHHFININADTVINNPLIKSGFYNQLYSGKSEILGRYEKSIQTTSSTSGVESYFSPSKNYYIRINGVFRNFGSQSSLLDALKDKKKQLRQYIKANGIVYRYNPEDAMVKIANYYDHL